MMIIKLQFRSTVQRFLSRVFAALIWSFLLTVPAILSAQTISQKANESQALDLESRQAQYRSVILKLAETETEILKLKNSEAQREFENIKSALEGLQAKRKLLDSLESKWAELGEGNKSALEIEPGLNSTEQTERQMLVELESSKEEVLRLKTEILKLKSEYGPGHPAILESARKLSDMNSVVQEQTEALELLGVEVKSSVAKEKLRSALVRQAELKSKFGSGHPSVVKIESEIAMLKGEVLQTPGVPSTGVMPSIELVNANLELREASAKFGKGHPIFKSLREKIDALEKIEQSQAAQDAPENKKALAKKLEFQIALLQTRIFDDESELDSLTGKRAEFKGLEKKNARLMKQREALHAEMKRLAPTDKSAEQLGRDEQEHISKQLLGGIDALESLGKSEEANMLREILSGLKN